MPKFTRGGAVAAALVCLMALAGCDSVEDRIERHYARGMELLNEGDPAKATLEFRNALQLDENHAPSRYEMARIYERNGDLRAAFGNYSVVAEAQADNVDVRIKLAQLLALGQSLDDATQYADAALALAPDNPDAIATKAVVLYRQGQTAEALEMARKALGLAPDNLAANILIASDQAQSGDVDAALARLDPLLAQNERDVTLNLLKLQILTRAGRDVAFEEHLRLMIERFPEEPQFKRELARWHAGRGESDKAEEQLRALAAADPENPQLALDVARFLLAGEGGVEAARAELEARIAAAPDQEAAAPFVTALAELQRRQGENDAARTTLRGVIDAGGPAAATARVQLARYLLQDGDVEGARALIEETLAADPGDVNALGIRAEMLIEADDPEGALRDLRTALDVEPENIGLILLEARAHERAGSPDLAGERLARAARLSEFRPDIAIRYAQFLASRDRLDAAETVLTDSVRRNPGDRQALLALAEARLRLGDWDGVQEVAAAIEAMADDAGSAERIRAAALGAQGRATESIEILQRLAESGDQGDGAIGALVAAYIRAGQTDDANALIDRMLADDPANVTALLLRAEVHLRAGQVAEAEARVREAISRAPANSAGHAALGRLQLALGQPDAAVSALRDGIEATNGDATLRTLLAGVLEQRGDFDGAIEQYDILHAAQPDSPVLANNLASLLAEHRANDPESLARAVRLAQRLRGSAIPAFQDTYGWVQFLNGDFNEAVRSLSAAADGLPNNAFVRYHAGRAFAAIERPAEARTHLEAALALDPGFAKADSAREILASLPQAATQ